MIMGIRLEFPPVDAVDHHICCLFSCPLVHGSQHLEILYDYRVTVTFFTERVRKHSGLMSVWIDHAVVVRKTYLYHSRLAKHD